MFNKRAVFALVAVCTLGATNLAVARDCSLKQFGSLDMTFRPDRGFSVPIELDGTVHPMVVSLGAYSFLTADAVKSLQLPTYDAKSEGMIIDNADILQKVIVPEVSIAGVTGVKLPMYVLPQSDRPMDGADGLMGTNLLRNFDAEFDFKDGKLNLFSHDHCEGQVVYWSDSAAILPFYNGQVDTVVLTMELDGMTVHADLNLQRATGGMFMDTAKRLFGLTPESPGMTVKTRDKNGVPTLYEYRFKSLSVGGVVVSNFVEDVFPPEPDKGYPCDGRPHNRGGTEKVCGGINDITIGLDVLRKLRLYFAFEEKKLYVTAADAHR